MKNCKILFFALFASVSILSNAQTYVVQINQPQILEAYAGNNIILSLGNSIAIGGNPSAMFGNGEYFYEWSPATWLDDPFAANPVSTPEDTISYTLTVSDFKGCVATDEITIFVTPASVPTHSFSDNFSILPNPNNGRFMIYSESEICLNQIKIFDITGRLVYQEEANNAENLYRSIDISSQPAGQYLIVLLSDRATYSGKFLIQ
jgi:hypothetical protein